MYNQWATAPGRSLTYPRLKSITHLCTFSDNGVYVALQLLLVILVSDQWRRVLIPYSWRQAPWGILCWNILILFSRTQRLQFTSIPPVLAALEGGSDKKTICQYGLKSIVYFDTCYLGIIFPKYLDSNFLQIFFMLLCVTGAKNGYKCVKYFIFHFFSHISWKIGLPLSLIVFMLWLGINLLVKKLLVLCFYGFCKKFAIYMFVWRLPKKLNSSELFINGSFWFQPLMSLKCVLTWTPCMLERTEIDGVT